MENTESQNTKKFSALYVSNGYTINLGDFATKSEAKEEIFRAQLNPNSFYNSHAIPRIEDHQLVVIDNEEQKLVYGKGGHAKMTTLSVCRETDPIIPDGHIPLFFSSEETASSPEYKDAIDALGLDDGERAIFHIDKREFDKAVDLILDTDTGYKYSLIKAKATKTILDSRFYSTIRDYSLDGNGKSLEDMAVGAISDKVAIHFGAKSPNDEFFEDTKKSLLINKLFSKHHEELYNNSEDQKPSPVSVKEDIDPEDIPVSPHQNNPSELISLIDNWERTAEKYEDGLFTEDFDKELDAVIDVKISEEKEKMLVVEPMNYMVLTPSDIEMILSVHKEIEEAYSVARVAKEEVDHGSSRSKQLMQETKDELETLLDEKAMGLSPKQIGELLESALAQNKISTKLKELALDVKKTVLKGASPK